MNLARITGVLVGPAFRELAAGRNAASRTSHPVLRVHRCTGCGTCRLLCPHQAISSGEGRATCIRYASCTGCGVCSAVCPARPPAIVMELGSAPESTWTHRRADVRLRRRAGA